MTIVLSAVNMVKFKPQTEPSWRERVRGTKTWWSKGKTRLILVNISLYQITVDYNSCWFAWKSRRLLYFSDALLLRGCGDLTYCCFQTFSLMSSPSLCLSFIAIKFKSQCSLSKIFNNINAVLKAFPGFSKTSLVYHTAVIFLLRHARGGVG